MTLNDLILSKVGGSNINTVLVDYYRINGATSFNLPTAEREFLLSKGLDDTGTTNDLWMQFLGNLGFNGTIDFIDIGYRFKYVFSDIPEFFIYS